MAEQVLQIIISVDVSELKSALSQMESDTRKATDTVTDEMGKAERSVKDSTKSMAESFSNLGHSINNAFSNVKGLMKGALLSSFPAFIPIVATATAGVGALGASFASAGTGAIGFGAVATTVLGDVFSASEDLAKAQEALDKAGNAKERAKALEMQEEAMRGLSEEQRRGVTALQEFKTFWDDLASSFETPVVDIFTDSLSILESVITKLQPTIEGSMRGVQTLVDAFSVTIESEDMKAFFEFINNNAQSSLENFGMTAINVFRGFSNLLVAFAPLSKVVEEGLVAMTQSFAEWSSQLGESEGFQQFLAYVSATAPIVIGLVQDLASIIGNLVVFLAPLGANILGVFGSLGGLLSGVLSQIKTAFDTGNMEGLISTIQSLAPVLVDSIVTLLDTILSTINTMLPILVVAGGELIVSLLNGLLENLPSIVTQLMTVISTIVNSISTLISDYLPQILQAGLGILLAIVNGIVQNLPMIITAVATLITTMLQFVVDNLPMVILAGVMLIEGLILGILDNLPILFEAITTIINTIGTLIGENLPLVAEMGISMLVSLIEGILDALPQIVNTILDLVLLIVTVILKNLPTILQAGLEIVMAVIKGIIEMLPELITCVIELIFAIQQALLDNLPLILEAGVQILIAVIDGILSMKNELDNVVLDIVSAVIEGFANVEWLSIGKDIISGIAKGITKNVGTVLSAITGVASSVIRRGKEEIGARSPSKVFEEEVGKTIPQGIAVGINKKKNTAINAVEEMENELASNRLRDVVNKIPNFASNDNSRSYENIFNISSLVVREEADLLKLAEQLNRVMERQENVLNRAGGRINYA